MCRRRIAKCSSVIGFIGKSLPVQGGRSGAEISCLSLTGADLAHGRERHPEVLRHLNRLHTAFLDCVDDQHFSELKDAMAKGQELRSPQKRRWNDVADHSTDGHMVEGPTEKHGI